MGHALTSLCWIYVNDALRGVAPKKKVWICSLRESARIASTPADVSRRRFSWSRSSRPCRRISPGRCPMTPATKNLGPQGGGDFKPQGCGKDGDQGRQQKHRGRVRPAARLTPVRDIGFRAARRDANCAPTLALPATNAKRLRKGAKRRSNPFFRKARNGLPHSLPSPHPAPQKNLARESESELKLRPQSAISRSRRGQIDCCSNFSFA